MPKRTPVIGSRILSEPSTSKVRWWDQTERGPLSHVGAGRWEPGRLRCPDGPSLCAGSEPLASVGGPVLLSVNTSHNTGLEAVGGGVWVPSR